MKRNTAPLLFLIFVLVAHADDIKPQGQILCDLSSNLFASDYSDLPFDVDLESRFFSISYEANTGQPEVMRIDYSFPDDYQRHRIVLKSVPNATLEKITQSHVAVVGQVLTDLPKPNYGYLEIRGVFDPSIPGNAVLNWTNDTYPDGNPMGILPAGGEWKDFVAPLDTTGAGTKLRRILFGVVASGKGTIRLRNLKLVQYDQKPVAAPEPPGAVVPEPPLAIEPPQGNTLYTCGWPEGFAKISHDPKLELNPLTWSLGVTYWGEVPTTLELQRVELNVLSTLSSNQFAIEGKLRYSKVAQGSFLEMWSYFAPENPGDPPIAYVTRTTDESGLQQVLTGDSDTRAFQLPFDMTGVRTHLIRVILRLHLNGGFGTKVGLEEAHFVQYPDGSFPSTVASVKNLSPQPNAPTPADFASKKTFEPSTAASGIDWKSFLLGVAATGLSLLLIIAAIFVSRLWRGRQHERELRRIASLDS